MVAPKIYGGAGVDWINALASVKQLSQVDGSSGQLDGNHLNLVSAVEMVGMPAQAEFYYRMTAKDRLF